MKRKVVESNDSSKALNNIDNVITNDGSFSVENKRDNDEPETKKLLTGKPSLTVVRSNLKDVKGALKKNSSSDVKCEEIDSNFDKGSVILKLKDNSQLVGSGPNQPILITSKVNAVAKSGKHLKGKNGHTCTVETKIHPNLSKHGTDGSQTKIVDLNFEAQNTSAPNPEDNSKNLLTSEKSFKQKVLSKKGKKNKTVMEKNIVNTKLSKIKCLPSTNQEQLAKPDWVALKKQKKDLRAARKEKRPSYKITIEAKQLWEVLRNQNNPSQTEDVQNGVIKMYDLLKSHLAMFVLCHDMSRVIQWLIKMATPEIRIAIIEELKPCITKMIINRYASKCIGSLLKYGAKEAANTVITCCMGHVVKFMSNVIAHPCLEKAYAEYATDLQKTKFHLEFYSHLYKFSKDSTVKCLADTYRDTPTLKGAILASTKENIKQVLNKNNATNRSTLLYAVIADFFKECSATDRDEMLSIVRGWIFDLPATKDAGHVGMLCVLHGSTKEKKAIVKGLKGHIVEFAKSKHLQVILLAVFSSVDDTVLLGKVLIPEVVANVKELGSHVVGRKLIVHLVSYGNTMFFHPSEMKVLHEGETTGTSKKDTAKKRTELLQLVSKPFLESVTEESEYWFKTTDTCLTALAILTGAEDGDDKQKAFEAVATLLVNPTAVSEEVISTPKKGKQKKNQRIVVDVSTETVETKPVPLISHSAVHLTIKHLIKENKSFPDVLTQKLTDEAMEYWIRHNRGCFILIHLLETSNTAVVARVTDLLKEHKALLTSTPAVGANILLKKL